MCQSASMPDSSVAAIRPRVGWCPTISTASLPPGHPVAVMTSAATAPVPTASVVADCTPSAEAVSWVRTVGLTSISQRFGRRGFSHAATRFAWSRPRLVSFRAESGLPSSASACRQRIKSIGVLSRNSTAQKSDIFQRRPSMAKADGVYRITEVIGTSTTSWEDAAKRAVETASKTLRDLRIAEVVKQDMKIENGKVAAYRTRVLLSFKYQK